VLIFLAVTTQFGKLDWSRRQIRVHSWKLLWGPPP